jgi:hypothetical protein
VSVTYEETKDGVVEAIYDGSQIVGYESNQIASIEPGGYPNQNYFNSDLPGFTIRYGRGFAKSTWRPTLAAAKAWVERKAESLLDY